MHQQTLYIALLIAVFVACFAFPPLHIAAAASDAGHIGAVNPSHDWLTGASPMADDHAYRRMRSMASCTTCSGQGTCSSSGVCACLPGFLGADCSITAGASGIPVYVGLITGLKGQEILQEWAMFSNYVQVRWTTNIDSWFGGIFNVGWDGMSSGDTWCYWVSTTTGTVFLKDYYSDSRSSPNEDTKQDLTLISGWRNTTHQVVEFTRLLNTGDSKDIVISSTPGTPMRFLWTRGLSSPTGNNNHGSSSSTTTENFKLSMHGYVGECGQWEVDWAGGTIRKLDDGLLFPRGYYAVFVLAAALLIVPFGFLFQRDMVKLTTFGRFMRTRPLKRLAEGEGEPGGCAEQGSNCLSSITCDFFSTFVNLSVVEAWFFIVYIFLNVAMIVYSRAQYDAVGRGWMYVFGHVASLHLAVSLLPVTHNSIWLKVFNVGFDTAIIWHRRLGRMAVFYLVLHLISMIMVWDVAVAFSGEKIEFGINSGWGLGGFLCFLVLLVTSLQCVRRNYYEIFLYSHVILMVFGNIMSMLHSITYRYLLIIPGFLWISDVLLRTFILPIWNGALIKSEVMVPGSQGIAGTPAKRARLVRVELFGGSRSDVPDAVMAITIRQESLKHYDAPTPGSHFIIRIPELSMLQIHTFSISEVRESVRKDDKGRLVYCHFITFHILAMGTGKARSEDASLSWTTGLYEKLRSVIPKQSHEGGDVANYLGYEPDAALSFAPVEPANTWATAPVPITIAAEGPYNSLNLPLFKYKVLVLVGGGIGVTPLISILLRYACELERTENILAHNGAVEKTSASKTLPIHIKLIWSSRKVQPLTQWFPYQLQRLLMRHAGRISIELYHTGVDAKPRNTVVRSISPAEGAVMPAHSLPTPPQPQRLIRVQENGNSNNSHGAVASSIEMHQVEPAVASVREEGQHSLAERRPSLTIQTHATVESLIKPGRPDFRHIFSNLEAVLPQLPPSPTAYGSPSQVASPAASTLTNNEVCVLSIGPKAMVEAAEAHAERFGFNFTHEAFEH